MGVEMDEDCAGSISEALFRLAICARVGKGGLPIFVQASSADPLPGATNCMR